MTRRWLSALLALGCLSVIVPPDAAAQFGRNKVQYRAFEWAVIETKHFDIYYYPEIRDAAIDAARMAERSYARLSRILQHEFRERKPIILYGSHAEFQQTNAIPQLIEEGTQAFAEPMKNRIVMPFMDSYSDFEHVLAHELVHAFQFDILLRRGFVSDGGPLGGAPPLWFMEGMAEYLALGEIDPHTAAWLRDATFAGYLRSIQEMNRRNDYLSYRFGQSLWAYIGERWGDEVIGILLQRTARMGVERAFRTTLGVSLAELSQEWMASVRQTYLAELTDRQRPEDFAERLTAHDGWRDPWYLAPSISADGSLMAYVSQQDIFFDLWLADARTGETLHRLVGAGREPDFESLRFMQSSAAFSPDGRYLAFSAQTGGRDALYIYDLRRRRVAERLRWDEVSGVSNPTWSPDGRQIVFSGLAGGISDLFATDTRGRLRRLTDDRYTAVLPAWSPDGRTIAFSTNRGEATDFDRLTFGNLRVALFDVETGEIEILPHQDEGKNLNPVWSPEGDALLWVSDRTGTNDLYLYELASGELSRLSYVLSGMIAVTPSSPVLSWAQEADRLLFVYFEHAGYNIYAVDDPRSLPRIPIEEAEPPVVAEAEIPESDPPVRDPGSVRIEGFMTSYYREGDEFRPSAMMPDLPITRRPLTVRELLDSADVALPDSADFAFRDYRVRFTPDMVGRPTIGAEVGGYYGNSVYGGSYIALSDILGNHHLLFSGFVNGSFSDATFFGGYSYLRNRMNYGFSLYQVPQYRYLGTQIEEGPVWMDYLWRDLIRGVDARMSYPFSTFRRIELGAGLINYRRDLLQRGVLFTGEPVMRSDSTIFSTTFAQPSAALVFDNALFGWTGPVFGRRYRIQVSHTVGDFSFAEGLVDFRNYMNFNQRFVLASRFISLIRQGSDADRFSIFWGGPYFVRGYDLDSFDRSECIASAQSEPSQFSNCPVRDQLIGSNAALMNVELRFPVITELQLGFLGNFPPVDALLFFDGGLAWNNQACEPDFSQMDLCRQGGRQDPVRLVWQRSSDQDPYVYRAPVFSYGAGLRFNIFYMVLRMDYARPLNRPDRRGGVFSFSFGPSF